MTTTTSTTAAQSRHESPELGAAAARMIRALVQRAAEGDTEALEQLAALEQLLPTALQLAGHNAHRWGYSHAELASVLGISRQASVKRFGALPLDSQCLEVGDCTTYAWGTQWLRKTYSSAGVMRALVERVTTRRAA